MAVHKALADDGLDAGAATIHFHLAQRSSTPPSISTIFRVLKARGFVTLSPKKRPKSSFKRFVADLPNETWQADMTHVEFGGGAGLRGAQHDRRPLEAVRGLSSHEGGQGQRRRPRPAQSGRELGLSGLLPQRQRAHLHHRSATTRWPGSTEQELFALGIEAKHARPYHPQTCGKVERFHQTMKKFLAMQDIKSPKQLQRQLDRFGAYYNEERPHRGIGRKTPAAVYGAREKAVPSPSFVKVGERRLRFDRVDKAGRITLRRRGRLHHIGIGNRLRGLARRHAHRRPRHRDRGIRRLTAAPPGPRPDQGLPAHPLSDRPRSTLSQTSVLDVLRHHTSAPGRIRTCAHGLGNRCSIP